MCLLLVTLSNDFREVILSNFYDCHLTAKPIFLVCTVYLGYLIKNLKHNSSIEVKFLSKLLNFARKTFPNHSMRVPEKEISGFGKYRVVEKR